MRATCATQKTVSLRFEFDFCFCVLHARARTKAELHINQRPSFAAVQRQRFAANEEVPRLRRRRRRRRRSIGFCFALSGELERECKRKPLIRQSGRLL